MAAPAQPNGFDHYRSGEPTRVLRGKADPRAFNHYRRGEPIVGIAAPSTVTGAAALTGTGTLTATGTRSTPPATTPQGGGRRRQQPITVGPPVNLHVEPARILANAIPAALAISHTATAAGLRHTSRAATIDLQLHTHAAQLERPPYRAKRTHQSKTSDDDLAVLLLA